MSSDKNCSQKFLQAASLSIKSQILKRTLKNFDEKVSVFMYKTIPLKKELESDLENSTFAQFPPLAYSTHVKKSKYTSKSSDENQFNEGRIISSERNSASEIANGCEQRYKGNGKSKKKLKKNHTEHSLVYSECKEDRGGDGCLSVVEVGKSVSSYCVSTSDIDSEEESLKLHTKNVIQSINTPKFDKTQKSLEEQKRLLKGQKRISISMNLDEGQMDINENERGSETYDSQKSTIMFFQNESSLQGCDISSSCYESARGTIDKSKKKYKKSAKRDIILSNILEQNEDYEKLAVSKYADLGDLDSDDELYLLQIPKSIDPKLMEGVSFSLIKKSKVKLGSKKYYIRPQDNNLKSFTTLSNDTIKTIKPLATLKIEEKHIKIKEAAESVIEEPKKNALPSCIKVQHPFLGANDESFLRKNKKYKNESGIKKEVPNYEEVESNETPVKKKKRKQKYLESTVVEFPLKNEPSEGHSSNSLKKRRNSILSNTRIIENLDISNFQFDISKIEDKKPVIKERKNCNGNEDNSDLINRLLLSTKNRLDISCKKEKRKSKGS